MGQWLGQKRLGSSGCNLLIFSTQEKPSFKRLKSPSLHKGQRVIKKLERKFILIFQTPNNEQKGGKDKLETEGREARNEESPASSKMPQFSFLLHNDQSEEKKQEKKKRHRNWKRALNAEEREEDSLETEGEEAESSGAGIEESPFFKRPESRFLLSNWQSAEKKQKKKKKHRKWRGVEHTEEGDKDALVAQAAGTARIKESPTFKRPESILLSNWQSEKKKKKWKQRRENVGAGDEEGLETDAEDKATTAKENKQKKKKNHRNWRIAEHPRGVDIASLETEADGAESRLDEARAWTSEHTYLCTPPLFTSRTLSFCQLLLSSPWLNPTSPLSQGQSTRKKQKRKQKYKQLGTQNQEPEGEDGRNEEMPLLKRPESVFPLCNEQSKRKKKQRTWRTENTGEGRKNGLQTKAEKTAAAARMKELGSSKKLKSSSALDMASNEKKKHCTEQTQRKLKGQKNEGEGDAQRFESSRKNEEAPPSKKLQLTSLLNKAASEKKKDALRQNQKKLRRESQREGMDNPEIEGGAEKNKETEKLKPTSTVREGHRDKKKRKQGKKHESRETEDKEGGEDTDIEEPGNKESCSFKRPRTASSPASVSAFGNIRPHSPPPVPIKRSCRSKEAGSCNKGEFPKGPVRKMEIQFHTRQREGIQICDHFLLGNCPQGSICELHHTRYPYHWQVKRKDSQVWQSVNDSAQRHLEKLYSDIERAHVKLIDKKALCGKLNLHTLEIGHHGPFSNIRRLSNTSDPEQNSHFPTEWAVYWQDGSMWKKYEEPLSCDFLAAFENGAQEHVFQLRGHVYTVNFKNHLIYNHNTGNTHIIQLRPTYRSPLQMLPWLCTIPSSPSRLHHPTSNIPGEDPTDGYSGPYPADWIKPPEGSVPFTKEEVLPSETAYHAIYTVFHKTLSEDNVLLLSVHRIRNDFLWQKYCSQKDLMSQGLSADEKLRLEKHLFHSTSARQLGFTCQIKFDTHLSGSHTYSRGCYFTVGADQADRYAQAGKGGLRHMLLAKILVGKPTCGKKHYCQLPQRVSGRECYDSYVDNVASPNIYVIFNSYQCYPYFLISYKLLSDPVVLDD
ncbi:uncharacterized protein LOC106732835 isoform X1 [Pelodiscus sinensis]|uniref:uncharacterized protein LOC106732835 isoform X1 n=1 Tax=Pelodiscus sinensis TaxID=13735 RepID=UPI003F6CACD4